MKRFIIVVALSCLLVPVKAQQYAPEKTYKLAPSNPIESNAPGLRMKKTGTALTIAGSVLLVAGVVLVSQADELYYNSTTTNGNTTTSGDPKGGFGVVMIAGGLGMLIPGVILFSKGSKRYKNYLDEQKTLSFNLRSTGFSLKYKL